MAIDVEEERDHYENGMRKAQADVEAIRAALRVPDGIGAVKYARALVGALERERLAVSLDTSHDGHLLAELVVDMSPDFAARFAKVESLVALPSRLLAAGWHRMARKLAAALESAMNERDTMFALVRRAAREIPEPRARKALLADLEATVEGES